MVPHVRHRRNALLDSALMVFVATVGVSGRAKLVRRPKSLAVLTVFVDPLPTTKTPMKNAGVGRVMASVYANNTMAYRVTTSRNVCPGIALTAFVVAMSAQECVTPARKPKKVKGMTGSAGRWHRARTQRTNAILGNAMVPERAINLKRHKPTGRRAYRVDNVRLPIASTVIVAIRRVRVRALRVARPKKAAA
jgi:hypothetical protein